MIMIPMMESMDEIINQMPELINRLEDYSGRLQSDGVEFVQKLESTAQKYRLPITGQLSVIRGELMCGAPIPDTAAHNRKEQKAEQKRYILKRLEAARSCVDNYFTENRKLFGECERLVCQVITQLVGKGTVNHLDARELTGKKMMELAAQDIELAPILIHVSGLVGTINTSILFEKTMSLVGLFSGGK